MKLVYITNGRIPSERANAMQTVQMCTAFATAGAEVTLYHPARRNPQFDGVDVWQYYGVPRAFRIQPVPCVDLFRLSNGRMWIERPVFLLQTFTFAVSLVQYTQAHTNLLDKRPGDSVNIETDIIARYVETLLAQRP